MANSDRSGRPDFRDRDATEAWLRTQPREVSAAIAVRAALRSLPLVYRAKFIPEPQDKIFAQIQGWGTPESCVAFRAISTSWVTLVASTGEKMSELRKVSSLVSSTVFVAATAAHVGTRAVGSRSGIFAADAALVVAKAASAAGAMSAIDAAAAASEAAYVTSYTAYDVVHLPEGRSAVAETLAEVAADRAAIVGGQSPEGLARAPVWPEGAPDWATKVWSDLKSHLLAADEGWEVWTEWYEARLRGDPFDPELERARALIPDEIWRQGPKAVNAEIARLIAAHREAAHSAMLDRIAALEARLAAMPAEGPAPIGHNNPPETIESEIEPIKAHLETLRRQPVVPDDPAEAVAATRGLKAALSRITGYAGGQLDIFITEAVRAGGRIAGPLLVAKVVLFSEGLAAVIDAAMQWLHTLSVLF